MKRIMAGLLALVMLFSLASCSMTEVKDDIKDEDIGTTEKGEDKDDHKTEDEADKKTVGQTLLAEFKKDSSGTALEIAERLVENKIIPFMGGAIAVEEGFLNGFENANIEGFREGATFGPMMSSIPFIGYIFELNEDTDTDAFKKELKEKANLRWNLCVEAEEMVVESEGKKVFFLMCPKEFDEDGDIDLDTEDIPTTEEAHG